MRTTADELVDATNVLVLGSSDSTGPPPLPPVERVLLVTFSDPPDELLANVRAEASPREARIVAVGDGARSAAAADAADVGPLTTVEHPADLTELGIRVGQTLDDWGDESLLVDFHSVTALLEHTTVERSFRFLHVLTGQLSKAGATAYFHLDPEANDQSAVATVRPLFDEVLRYDEEWQVQ